MRRKPSTKVLFIDSLFYKPTRFEQRTLTIISCYNCQKVGHVSLNCESNRTCGHFSGNHSYNQRSKSEPHKCNNGHGKHPADSTDCPTYLKQTNNVYNARGILIPISVQQRIENLGNKINDTRLLPFLGTESQRNQRPLLKCFGQIRQRATTDLCLP